MMLTHKVPPVLVPLIYWGNMGMRAERRAFWIYASIYGKAITSDDVNLTRVYGYEN